MEQVNCSACGTASPAQAAQCKECGAALPGAGNGAGAASCGPMFQKNQTIANRYIVRDIIGRGGMGLIYRVYDSVLKELVALKTLLPEFTQDKLVVSRFFNEARIARQLSHPNIVRVHDIGMANDIVYISMEYLEGRTLRSMLEKLPPGQRLPIAVTLHTFGQLCAALEYAHRYTIHRDIKPDNVMIGSNGEVKLMDFGISKLMSSSMLTETSVVMGTPFYMSPEQLRNSKDVDARADIYSLGVMLYEILTGNIPTGMPKPASQLIRDVPPALDPIVARCVEVDRAKRYASAAELRKDLVHIAALLKRTDAPEIDNATPEALKRSEPSRRPLLPRAVGVLAALAIAAGAVYGLWFLEGQKGMALAEGPNGAVEEAGTGAEDRMAAIQERFESLRDSMAPRLDEMTEAKREVHDYAVRQWKKSQDTFDRDPEAGLGRALEALQALVALVEWRPGMCFVPAGPISLEEGDEPIMIDSFFIDETEVTNEQFLAFRGNGFVSDDDRHLPVVYVCFYEAQYFAAMDGKRLPTEAQWARAAYGQPGASQYFPWDDAESSGACNALEYDEDGTPIEELTPVGSFPEDVSPHGCFDMVGGVSEWTRTAAYSYQGGDDSAGLFFGAYVATRGGSFMDEPIAMIQSRDERLFEMEYADLGFRCVYELSATLEDVDRILGR